MANDIQLDGLIENVNGALFGGDQFLVISLSCNDHNDAIRWASALGMKSDAFEEGTVKVSRMGVNAVELSCGDHANVILSWQGARPDKATEVDDEDADDEDDNE